METQLYKSSHNNKPHQINKMSIGFLRNQLEYINRTGINIEFKDALLKEYKERIKHINVFLPLSDNYFKK